jgi:hypothetical protein
MRCDSIRFVSRVLSLSKFAPTAERPSGATRPVPLTRPPPPPPAPLPRRSRDLKAKNLLVRDAKRGRTGEVVKLTIAFTDWGTAVKLPEEGKRRMTLHGPGTAGYIAPDTRGPTYDYGADMWAYLVWAASMCLKVECVVDCQVRAAPVPPCRFNRRRARSIASVVLPFD